MLIIVSEGIVGKWVFLKSHPVCFQKSSSLLSKVIQFAFKSHPTHIQRIHNLCSVTFVPLQHTKRRKHNNQRRNAPRPVGGATGAFALAIHRQTLHVQQHEVFYSKFRTCVSSTIPLGEWGLPHGGPPPLFSYNKWSRSLPRRLGPGIGFRRADFPAPLYPHCVLCRISTLLVKGFHAHRSVCMVIPPATPP